MVAWDNFIDEVVIVQKSSDFLQQYSEKPYFKQLNRQSFMLFRKLTQYIDCSLLHVETLKYQSRSLVASLMYLMLGIFFGLFTEFTILNEIARTSAFLYNNLNGYNDIFNIFLNKCFNLELDELLPTVKYCANYFNLPISDVLPIAAKKDPADVNIIL